MSLAVPHRLRRVAGSRKASLTGFAITLGALLLAAAWFTTARQSLGNAYDELAAAQQSLAAAEQRLREAELRARLAGSAEALVEEARASGHVGEQWGERLINVAQSPMPREDVNHLLASVARDERRLFGADAFDLSVTRPDEGLFETTDPRSPPLMVTLRGTLLFRTSESP